MAEQPIPQAVAEPQDQKPDPLAISVSRAVADLRRSAGLSERGAAKLLKTSQTQLRRMEDPRYLPSLRSLARLATAYGQRVVVTFEALQPKPAKQGKRLSASASPSKGRQAAPGRARGGARAKPRRAAPRRRR